MRNLSLFALSWSVEYNRYCPVKFYGRYECTCTFLKKIQIFPETSYAYDFLNNLTEIPEITYEVLVSRIFEINDPRNFAETVVNRREKSFFFFLLSSPVRRGGVERFSGNLRRRDLRFRRYKMCFFTPSQPRHEIPARVAHAPTHATRCHSPVSTVRVGFSF